MFATQSHATRKVASLCQHKLLLTSSVHKDKSVKQTCMQTALMSARAYAACYAGLRPEAAQPEKRVQTKNLQCE